MPADSRSTIADLISQLPNNTSGLIDAPEIRSIVKSFPVHADTVAPTTTDDSSLGYNVGDFWINTTVTPTTLYQCEDNTASAAVWVLRWPAPAGTSSIDVIYAREEQPSGTNGGASTASTWLARTLNIIKNDDTGGASLASNQITVPSGTYRVTARSPFYQAGPTFFKTRLYDVTNSAVLLVSGQQYGDSGAASVDVVLEGVITLSTATTLELQYFATAAKTTNGLGVSTSADGEIEIYSEIWLERGGAVSKPSIANQFPSVAQNDFTAWTKQTNATVTANTDLNPFGTATDADTMGITGSTGRAVYYNTGIQYAGRVWRWKVWLKAKQACTLVVQIADTGVGTSRYTAYINLLVADGWQEFAFVLPMNVDTGSSTLGVQLYPNATVAGDYYAAWGNELEDITDYLTLGIDNRSGININAQTGTTYTLALTDAEGMVTLDNAAAITLTVPPSTSVAFPVGTTIALAQLGAGKVTVAAGAGVTIKSYSSLLSISAQNLPVSLTKLATDTWLLTGALA